MEIISRQNFFISLLSICLLLTYSCDNPNTLDCFQKAGKEASVEFHDIPWFINLILLDDFDLQIIESDTTYFKLIYYENLIPEVSYHSEDETITFKNGNNCNFVRDFKTPLLQFYSKKEHNRIISYSTGKIFSEDTLKNRIAIFTDDISGQVNLTVNNKSVRLSSTSTTNFKISGSTRELLINALFNDGKFDCSQLRSKQTKILHRGYNDIITHPVDSLYGSIENAGILYYYGNPAVNINISGGGKLIQLQ